MTIAARFAMLAADLSDPLRDQYHRDISNCLRAVPEIRANDVARATQFALGGAGAQ